MSRTRRSLAHCAYFATFAALQERVEQWLKQLQADPTRVQQLLGTPWDAFIGWEAPLAA